MTEAICPAASSWVEGAMRQEILLLLRFFLLFRLYSIHDVIICNLQCLAPLFEKVNFVLYPFGLLPWLSILVEILSLDLDTFVSRIGTKLAILAFSTIFRCGRRPAALLLSLACLLSRRRHDQDTANMVSFS